MAWTAQPAEIRGSTRHVAGLWPFGVGSAPPLVGVPMGQHQQTGAAVCCDPISWFEAGVLSNPNMFVASQPGLGKALDVNTLVPTPTGTARIGDLRPGDTVYDEHGQPTTVVAVSGAITGRDCLRVRFSDGTDVVADAGHLWVTETVRDRQRRHNRRLRRPPAALGTPAEQQRVAALLKATSPRQTTTLLDLAVDLGWRDDGRWHRLYRWGKQIPAVATGRYGTRIYDKTLLLQQVAMALAGPTDEPVAPPAPVTTRQIAQTLHAAGKVNHAIPVTGINGEHHTDLPLPPRLLGLWLGDGNTDGPVLTTADPQLADEFTAAGFTVRPVHRRRYQYSISAPPVPPALPDERPCQLCGTAMRPRYLGHRFCSLRCASRGNRAGLPPPAPVACPDCDTPRPRKALTAQCRDCASRASLIGRLRAAGVLGAKHIPTVYLRASVAQRQALLSGLLDTDGTVAAGGHVQYTSTSRRLADDVRELVASLGYRAAFTARPAKLAGRVVGTSYTVGFSTRDRVFGLDRKHDVHQARRADVGDARTRVRYIVAADPVPSRPVCCIQVANSSGMYLVTESFVATHNSTAVRRIVLGYAHTGITSLMLGDLKPDYVDLVGALGGQVIRVGPGRDAINPLDAGAWRDAVPKLDPGQARLVRDDVIARRRVALEALATLARGAPLDDRETTVLAAACRLLTERERDAQPTLREVIATVMDAPDEVRAVTLDLGDDTRYWQRVERLLDTLIALREGVFGNTFAGQTTTPLHLDACAVTIDIRAIGTADEKLTAATLLTMWAHGFAQIETAHLLADLGLAPKRRFFAVLDELWRALRAPGLVDRLDGLTRLSRAAGTGLAYISHGLDDLEALAAEHDRAKARGIAERCALKLFGGLSPQQLTRVRQVVGLSDAEIAEVAAWSQQDGGAVAGDGAGRAGRGRFLIKTGSEPGLPVLLHPTAAERRLGDTDSRFYHTAGGGGG
jgi:hypothetical protein